MTQAQVQQGAPTVRRRLPASSRTKINASLAMVVCFIGFQGIVPTSADTAVAVSFDDSSRSSSVSDHLLPTGTVGPFLLQSRTAPDALDPMLPPKGAAREGARTGAVLSNGVQKRPAAGSLFAPLAELVPTSSFGFRTSPITGQPDEFHTGQDFAAPCGTTVVAADAGTVRAVGWHQWGGGNRVEVDHGNGLVTTYNHLQGISVKEGDTVSGGDPIAELGTTGSSTGCHLHFETILDGEHVDPMRWSLVQTAHGASRGPAKDYSPVAGGPSDIPVWAQSSTRSDQSRPGILPVPVVVPAPAALPLPAVLSAPVPSPVHVAPPAPVVPSVVQPSRAEVTAPPVSPDKPPVVTPPPATPPTPGSVLVPRKDPGKIPAPPTVVPEKDQGKSSTPSAPGTVVAPEKDKGATPSPAPHVPVEPKKEHTPAPDAVQPPAPEVPAEPVVVPPAVVEEQAPSCDVVATDGALSADAAADQESSTESSTEDATSAAQNASTEPAADDRTADEQTPDEQTPDDEVSDEDASDAAAPTCAPSTPETESDEDPVTAPAPDADAAKSTDPAVQERTED